MKRVLLAVVLLMMPLAAFAAPREWVLLSDGTLNSLEVVGNGEALSLVAHTGPYVDTNIVPATFGIESESDPHLLVDRRGDKLVAIWNHDGAIVTSTRNLQGDWTPMLVIAEACSTPRKALHATLTSTAGTVFLHAVWWDGEGSDLSASYALVAFGSDGSVSKWSGAVESLVAGPVASSTETAAPDALPMLALTPAGAESVDVVFGSRTKRDATRVRVTPKLQGEAKIWVPVGRQNGAIERPRLEGVSAASVELLVNGARVVAYVPGETFRYFVFDGERWSAARTFSLSDEVTASDVVHELARALATEDLRQTPADSE
ncbi:MAG TPA: hypothetical protein VFN10_05250 [Thermoanaerobaculia bacterium]|nr:hypothetical protein [Thermoanaerobaculia bacterium]